MRVPVLTIPGIGNSGPAHWQSIWESRHPEFTRVHQDDWDHPVCAEWAVSIERQVASAGRHAVLVAHSLGCLALAYWAFSTRLPIAGALLVAVPDPAGPQFPTDAVGFAPVPLQRFAFASVVVASSDDPYGSPAYARRCASAWGSRLFSIGPAGHINAASGLGEWREGYELLDSLRGLKNGNALSEAG
jgi:predicted alpha/beta hydrolase family esterase